MAASASSPCGACRFLRRKCVNGCIFAPYFHYEQAAAHFSAIHKVFGASNASKLLAHLPVTHRWEAAVTISYEALARLQDPIYGCVSHIFALQQQVLNLQVQLAHLREQAAAQILLLNSYATRNPSDELLYQKPSQDHLETWLPTENLTSAMPEFDEPPAIPYVEMSFSTDDSNLMGGYAGDFCLEEIIARSISSSSFDVQINDEL